MAQCGVWVGLKKACFVQPSVDTNKCEYKTNANKFAPTALEFEVIKYRF